jgi:hypothetical protein
VKAIDMYKKKTPKGTRGRRWTDPMKKSNQKEKKKKKLEKKKKRKKKHRTQ